MIMTKEEAIERLNNIAWEMASVERIQNIKALDMAILALAAEPNEPNESIFIKTNIMYNSDEFEELNYKLHKQNKNIILLPSETDLIVNGHRPTGTWIKEVKHYINDNEREEYYYAEYHCSNCGEEPLFNRDYINSLTPYCPWCGARMEEE